MPSIRGISLDYVCESIDGLTIGRVECSLAVETIYDHAKNNVASIDECLGKHQSFPEVVTVVEYLSTSAYKRACEVVLTVGASQP